MQASAACFKVMEYLYGEIDDAVIVELCRQQHLALPEDLREEEPEQLEEDDSLEEIDISAGDYSPPPETSWFLFRFFWGDGRCQYSQGPPSKAA